MKSTTIERLFKGFYKRTENLYGSDGEIMAYRFFLYATKCDQVPKINLTIINPSIYLSNLTGCQREAKRMLKLINVINGLKDM